MRPAWVAAFTVIVALAVAAAVTYPAAGAPATGTASVERLKKIEARQLHGIAEYRGTLRFFEAHPAILYSGPLRVRKIGWKAVRNARAHIRWRTRELDTTRTALRARLTATSPIGDPRAWSCIHSGYKGSEKVGEGEGAWNDPDAPYWGGLQMDLEFQRTYGPELLRRKGTADNWTPREQMIVAERARRSGRGYFPWPTTARACGLI